MKNLMLSDFQPLIGRWTAKKIAWSEQTRKLAGGPPSVQAPASFDWTQDGCFLVHTVGGEGAPLAHWMIGRDETSGAFAVLYADSRGVSRIYEMSLANLVWRIWRTAPGFHQRFTGRISPDRRRNCLGEVDRWQVVGNRLRYNLRKGRVGV